jgi:tRNA(Leu) C34 or U34 (ribose-2'-O)-methylase TrmL
MSAAIFLQNPKTPANVGGVIRAASIFGAEQVWWDGDRVHDNRNLSRTTGTGISKRKWRLPREERMKAYNVAWGVDEGALHRLIDEGFTPVCVELTPGAELLPAFEHPEKAVYVFGPEDGGVSKGVRHACHRFVQIPGKHCLNLAAAVNIVLYTRFVRGMYGWSETDAQLVTA